LSLIGAIGAALTLGLRGGGVLLALLVLPLYVPVLILGAGAVEMAGAGLDPGGELLLLGAALVVAAAFSRWAKKPPRPREPRRAAAAPLRGRGPHPPSRRLRRQG